MIPSELSISSIEAIYKKIKPYVNKTPLKKASKNIDQDFDTNIYLKFEGKTFSIPNLIEDYLTYRYGDWRIPIDDGSYDYRKDDNSIVFSQILETNTIKSNGGVN